MDIKKALKNLLRDTSIIFMLVTVAYAAIMVVVNVNADQILIDATFLLYVFLFSLLVSISQCLYRIKTINKALRVTIQLAIILFSSYVCFFLPLNMQPSQILIGLILTLIIYFIIYGTGAFFIWRFNKNTKKEEEYTSQFKKHK